MKLSLKILLTLLVFTYQTSFAQKLKVIEFNSNVQLIDEEGKIANFSNQYQVINFGELRMVRQLNPRIFTETTINKQGEYISKRTLKQDTIVKYLVYKKGSIKGLLYEYEDLSKSRPFLVDSLVRTLPDSKIFNVDSLKWVRTDVISNDAFKEIYSSPYKPVNDETALDSVYLVYNKRLKNTDLSLSNSLDEKKQSKLVKITIVFPAMPKGKFKFELPKREIVMEIKETKEYNPTEIADMFRRFKKETVKDKK